jgi:hypothetical protein
VLVAAVGLHGQGHHERVELQLCAVCDLELADRVADRRQLAFGDLHRLLVGVKQIEPVPDFAAAVRAFADLQLQPEQLPVAGLGGLHLALHDLRHVLAGRQQLERCRGLDAGRVEGAIQ